MVELAIVNEDTPRCGDSAAWVRVDGKLHFAEWRGEDLVYLDKRPLPRDLRARGINAPNIVVKGEGNGEGRRITLLGEKLHDPDAPGYDSNGYPQVRSEHERREFYEKKRINEGREVHVDPDGGMPHGDELRAHLQRQRVEKAQERKRVAKERIAPALREWREARRTKK